MPTTRLPSGLFVNTTPGTPPGLSLFPFPAAPFLWDLGVRSTREGRSGVAALALSAALERAASARRASSSTTSVYWAMLSDRPSARMGRRRLVLLGLMPLVLRRPAALVVLPLFPLLGVPAEGVRVRLSALPLRAATAGTTPPIRNLDFGRSTEPARVRALPGARGLSALPALEVVPLLPSPALAARLRPRKAVSHRVNTSDTKLW
jgi:hypothetical protein